MMKTLVVYYSRTGHNAEMAQQLHDQLPGELDQIIDSKNRDGMFGCVMSAIFKSKTKIRFNQDPRAYDQTVVVTPLWAGSLPPATRTYLTQNRDALNQFSILSVCGKGDENTDAIADVISTAKQQPLASLLIKEEEVDNETSKQKVAAFVNQLPH